MNLVTLIDLLDHEQKIRIFYGSDPVFINEETYYKISSLGLKLEEGYAYVIGDYCYPFRGKKKLSENEKLKVGIYQDNHKNYYARIPSSTKERELFSIEHIVTLSIQEMWDDLSNNKDHFITDVDREMINSNKKKYTPTIKTTDDALQKIVKYAIIGKNTNINMFQKEFDKEHGLTNLKTTLKPNATMTMKRFIQWADMLNIGYRIIAFDNGHDIYYPLPYEIHYNSITDEIMLFDEKGKQVDTDGRVISVDDDLE